MHFEMSNPERNHLSHQRCFFFLAICLSVTYITRFKWVFVIIYNPVLSSGPAEESQSVLDAKRKQKPVHLSRKKKDL